MDSKQYERIHTDNGFLAALDQSGGSTPKALLQYGIGPERYHGDEEMFQLVHAMRTRIIKSPAFNAESILGAILFENTLERTIDGIPTADYLWEKKGVVPFLKVDQGLAGQENGVQLMKPIQGLDELLKKAVKRHVFGTKMRSVIQEANPQGIRAIVAQQFAVGRQIFDAGLIPILEPEVDIHSADKVESETILKLEILEHLAALEPQVKVMLKLSIPTKDDFYADLIANAHVVRVVALSGGYSREEANIRLARNHGLIASFSRALAEGLNDAQNDAAFDRTLADSIRSIYAASVT